MQQLRQSQEIASEPVLTELDFPRDDGIILLKQHILEESLPSENRFDCRQLRSSNKEPDLSLSTELLLKEQRSSDSHDLTIDSGPTKFARSAGQYDFRQKLAILRHHAGVSEGSQKKVVLLKSFKSKANTAYPEPEPIQLIKEAVVELNNEPEPLQDASDKGPITINLPIARLRNDQEEQHRIRKVVRLLEILADQHESVLRVTFLAIIEAASLNLEYDDSDSYIESGLNSSESPNFQSQRQLFNRKRRQEKLRMLMIKGPYLSLS